MRLAALAIGTCLLASLAQGADDVSSKMLGNWPAWRGPLASGVAPLGKPPLNWDENTGVKWKVKIPGEGDSSPIVWNDKVFLVTAVKTDRKGEPEPDPNAVAKDDKEDASKKKKSTGFAARAYGIVKPTNYYQFIVMCLDRGTGKVVWQDVANEVVPHEGHHPDGSFASASPCTDGRRVYVSFGSRGIYCYDMQGKKLWSRDFGRMNIFSSFGEGCSPAVYGDSVIINWDHQGDSFIVCLDAKTGETKWKTKRDETSTWATPLVVETGGRTQVVTNGTLRVRGYDLETGQLLWACGGQGPSAIPSPVTNGHLVFAMTGFITNSLYAIPLDARGDITGQDDKVAWKTRKVASPYVPSPLLYGNLLYFTAGNKGILSCYDVETGKPVLDRQRLQGISNVYASPVGADNRIYITSREGTTVVFERGKFEKDGDKNKVEIVATNKLDDQFNASAAIVGHEMFLRGNTHLYCISGE
jgi:outer membrane protein assembly factor BamB